MAPDKPGTNMSLSPSPTHSDEVSIESESAIERVSLTLAEYEVLKARASSSVELSPPPKFEEEALRGELELREARLATLEKRFRETLRERELATALAGKPLVPGAATQLIKLWQDDFDVYEERGEYRVSSNDGRNVTKAVADRLASPEFAHFCLPASRGGSPSAESTKVISSSGSTTPPKTLGEAILAQWRDLAGRSKDVSAPFGLGRR